jgi:hypothetical protein
VLATNLNASPAASYHLYRDRWPVEQVPLVAKQMLGLHRHFVFATASIWRLPELALLLGNVLTIVAASLPAIPSGYWDRHPEKRPAGYDAHFAKLLFPMLTHWTAEFGKKHRLQATYRRELRLIAAVRGRCRLTEWLLQLHFGPHC